MRYLSHLELTKAIMRAMRRANFPLKYSSGFHPSPRVSFGPALGVGIAGLREYLDLELIPPFEIETLRINLNKTLPEGIRVERIAVSYGKEKSLDSFIMRYLYDVAHDEGISVERFLERDEVLVRREKGLVDLKELVEAIERVDNRTVRLTVRDQGAIRVRLEELLAEIFGEAAGNLEVTRIAMFGWDGDWVKPMEGEEIWAAKS
jgi:radical SAM-linked protein